MQPRRGGHPDFCPKPITRKNEVNPPFARAWGLLEDASLSDACRSFDLGWRRGRTTPRVSRDPLRPESSPSAGPRALPNSYAPTTKFGSPPAEVARPRRGGAGDPRSTGPSHHCRRKPAAVGRWRPWSPDMRPYLSSSGSMCRSQRFCSQAIGIPNANPALSIRRKMPSNDGTPGILSTPPMRKVTSPSAFSIRPFTK